ncbi:MAG TPA: hydroxyacylglutathione hydrolase [Gallionella sp.]|nr:hydroxyacylglutathione hydrolase [Gallionella sp.]
MFNITAISAFTDNYIWAIHNDRHAVIVDPGEAAPVLSFLAARKLALTGIFCTHRHHDHIGGIAELRAVYNVPVFGRRHEKNPHISHAVREGEQVNLNEFGLVFDIMEIPGHLDDHIAFIATNITPPILFCGDVLFGAGCGKNFEGTVAQLHHSLQRLSRLPDITLAYCAHEYTASNLRFALACEPGNSAVQQRVEKTREMRAGNLPTVPFTLALEKATNPFLRCNADEIIKTLQQRGLTDTRAINVFTALRAWRDNF